MAVEKERGCGYRKVGGLYMVAGGPDAPCGRLPIELHVCAACHQGIHQTRGFTWIKPTAILGSAPSGCSLEGRPYGCGMCPLSTARLAEIERVGLIWVGEKFYPEPDDFMREARAQGISRRMPAIPRGFELGKDWVMVAHPRAICRKPNNVEERNEALDELKRTQEVTVETDAELAEVQPLYIHRKGIITMFKPTAWEKIVTDLTSDEELAALAEKGMTPVVVPHDDPDHQDRYSKDVVKPGREQAQLVFTDGAA